MLPLRRVLFLGAALGATAALAWASLPTTFPATYAVTETDRLSITVSAAGRSVTQNRRVRASGTLVLEGDGGLRFEDPGQLLPANEATWTASGRSAIRFVFTQATKDAIREEAVRQFADKGVNGAIRIRFGPGRLVFSRDASTLQGSEIVRTSMRGRYRGVPFTAASTVNLSWKGTRTP